MKTIAVDIDDVLAANAASFVAFSNERWGTNLTVDDYDEHWSRMWDVSLAETERRSSEFHDSGVIGRYEHFDAAMPVLDILSQQYNLVIITARRKSVADETKRWIADKFPAIFSEVHFAGIWDNHTHQSHIQTKAELCVALGADYLIDDQLKHCIGAAEKGIQALLFGDYSWNQAEQLPAAIVRCHDWGAVKEYFETRNGS